MNKKLKTALLFGIPVLVGGYFIYKQVSKPTPIKPTPTPEPTPTPNPTTEWSKFKVITVTDPLNVRQLPSTTSAVIDKLAIGSQVWAKSSSTSGWHEYSKDGSTRFGYVSSQYIQAI